MEIHQSDFQQLNPPWKSINRIFGSNNPYENPSLYPVQKSIKKSIAGQTGGASHKRHPIVPATLFCYNRP